LPHHDNIALQRIPAHGNEITLPLACVECHGNMRW
jgi:hypothetical protein